MNKAKGYSLWLMPEGKPYLEIKKMTSNFSKILKKDYFEPHVTLLGNISCTGEDILSKTSYLASIMKPFEIELYKLNFGKEYFKRLFFLAKNSKYLTDSNEKAKKVFNIKDNSAFIPHASLVYSYFAVPKQLIKQIIPRDISIKFRANSLTLINANGSPKDWYKIQEFPLK